MNSYLQIESFVTNILLYILLFTLFSVWLNFFFFKQKIFSVISKVSTITSVVLLIGILGGRWATAHYFPLSNLYESILFLCTILLIGQFIAEIKLSTQLLGCLNLPLVFGLYRFATSVLPPEMRKATGLPPSLQSNWLMMHVSIIMTSYAVLILGSLLSVLFLLLNQFKPTVKTKNLINSNVSLQSNDSETQIATSSFTESLQNILDAWSYRLIGLGFPLLTIGIISGAIWANEAWGAYWSWDPKESWALITWLVFAIYLHARLVKGWAKKNAAIIGSVGFFVIWICYLGVNFLSKGLHSYGLIG
uniref:Cytochrome c biogenesis protein CcsA n=1 Tax=Eustigmatophyceae sp. Mont 10/10-1w TaxID=2506145 RepID=A0A3R5U9P3_9STRA|nr:heme attachment to plastid cytochrome c [Eustigmatophyceae sp. Mont 10/10-1w]QAA11719.1 heme attachment to plastid cytochrome c [Eustigmatophyceae sp. Mont 10/10-1w]